MLALAVAAPAGSGLALAQLPLGAAVPEARAQSRALPMPYLVGPGDVLDVEVHAGGGKQDEFAATVTPAGLISCPLIGDVPVAGFAPPAIAQRLTTALGDGYYVQPQVLVSVRSYAGSVRVVGEVRHPGIYPMSAQLTVLSACDLAGGLTDYASGRRVRLSRIEAGQPRTYTLDLVRIRQGRAEDISLRNWDRIEIPHRWF